MVFHSDPILHWVQSARLVMAMDCDSLMQGPGVATLGELSESMAMAGQSLWASYI